MARLFGLIGYPLSHSFSKRYFTEKFLREGIADCAYELFPIERIDMLPGLIARYPDLCGLNVTIPYKQSVIPLLNAVEPGAGAVGAVNTIKVEEGRLTGYNTDVYGFRESLHRFLADSGIHPAGALILGTGGAAKAVAWVLRQMAMPYLFVSRQGSENRIPYELLDREHLARFPLLINTTPLGMAPETERFPPVPYEYLTAENLLFDLVYNPEQTVFLQRGKLAGCATANGLDMLYLQAEKAWEVWTT